MNVKFFQKYINKVYGLPKFLNRPLLNKGIYGPFKNKSLIVNETGNSSGSISSLSTYLSKV
jgi:hypothetical protein